MTKANKTSFKEGKSGNPKGKAKGTYSPLRRQLMVLKNLAAEKAEEAFNDLWRDFKAGDPLAKQIYFKELVVVPKEWLSEVNTEDLPREVRNAEDVAHCALKLIEKLLNADNMSTQEALDLLRILKNNSVPEGEANVVRILSREELIEKINLTRELIDLKKENGEKA